MVIIDRVCDASHLEHLGKKIIIAGRRKTGKTFFARRMLKPDHYYFVKREGSILTQSYEEISEETLAKLLPHLSGRIVIDEFQRLSPSFLDTLHALGGEPFNLILLSSSSWLARSVLSGPDAPLLGIFSLYPFPLAHPVDILSALCKHISAAEECLEAAVYLQEPLLAQPYTPPLRSFLPTYLASNNLIFNDIILEAFSEERKHYSRVYATILEGISMGKHTTTELASFAFARKRIPKDTPTAIISYLDTLIHMRILTRIPVLGKKKYVYQHTSPLLDLHYTLIAKYAYTDVPTPPSFIRAVLDQKLPFHMERFIERILTLPGLQPVRIEHPEVDIALTRFQRLHTIAEVKWKHRLTKRETREAYDTLLSIPAEKRLFITKTQPPLPPPQRITILLPKEVVQRATCPGTPPQAS